MGWRGGVNGDGLGGCGVSGGGEGEGGGGNGGGGEGNGGGGEGGGGEGGGEGGGGDIETCADDLQGLLAADGLKCEQIIAVGCDTAVVTLNANAGLPADVVIEELCPLACGQCTPRCGA